MIQYFNTFFERKNILFVFGLLICLSANAQVEFASGMDFEDDEYDLLQRVNPLDGSKSDLPPFVNLEPYCPDVRHQGDIFSCVGWSTGYGAMTIQSAIVNETTDRTVINENAHSALFLYNQIKTPGTCMKGTKISKALDFLSENGNCLAGQFDFDVENCDSMPSEALKTFAQDYVIEDYLALYGTKDDPDFKVSQVKKTLAKKRPVIIGMSIKKNFYLLKDAKYWHPNIGETAPAGGHAMVVVGYDDRKEAFRLFNSWGKNWGDNGFIWVKYKDFGRYCKYGYVLYLLPKPLLEKHQEKVKMQFARMAAKRAERQEKLKKKQRRSGRPQVRTRGLSDLEVAQRQLRRRKAALRARMERDRGAQLRGRDTRAGSAQNGNEERVTERRSNTRKPKRSQGGAPTASTETVAIVDDLKPEEQGEQAQLEGIDDMDYDDFQLLVTRPLVEIKGAFSFKSFLGFNEYSSMPEFENAEVTLSNTNVYKTTQTDWEVGHKFQLHAETQMAEQYVYVFSIDAKNQVNFHWPRREGLNQKFSGMKQSPLLLGEDLKIIMPGETKALTLANSGTDRLVVLFSKIKIRGVKQLAKIVSEKEGDFMEVLLHTLGDYAVPQSDITYFNDRIGFETSTRSEGYIVPLVLEVETL